MFSVEANMVFFIFYVSHMITCKRNGFKYSLSTHYKLLIYITLLHYMLYLVSSILFLSHDSNCKIPM